MAFNIENFKVRWSIPGRGKKGKEPVAYKTMQQLIQILKMKPEEK